MDEDRMIKISQETGLNHEQVAGAISGFGRSNIKRVLLHLVEDRIKKTHHIELEKVTADKLQTRQGAVVEAKSIYALIESL